jgi:hypothetical protein
MSAAKKDAAYYRGLIAADAAYYRRLIAAAATIESRHVTQFSPEGLGEMLGQSLYYVVQFGRDIFLRKDGKWQWATREGDATDRMAYAFKTPLEALAALRVEVAPDEPACAEVIETVYASHAKEKV